MATKINNPILTSNLDVLRIAKEKGSGPRTTQFMLELNQECGGISENDISFGMAAFSDGFKEGYKLGLKGVKGIQE